MNAIEINGVTKRYKDFCLDNLTLTLPTGTILGLVGENGAGKSTTIKLIMGASMPDSGTIKVLGNPNTGEDFTSVKQDIGIVLDELHYPDILNTGDIAKIMQNSYINWDNEKYNELLKKFRLPEKKPISDFSRGMKMKLAIATALSHSAKLLVLDEATGGLDPVARDELLDIINEYTRNESNSVLMSSHILTDLEKICDYIAFIKEGQLLLCEEKDTIMERYAIIKLTPNEYKELQSNVVISAKRRGYGYEVLVDRDLISPGITVEKTSLEDIFLFFSKR